MNPSPTSFVETLIGGAFEIADRLVVVAFYAATEQIGETEIVLRLTIAVVGCLLPPTDRGPRVFGDAAAIVVQHPEIELRARIAPAGQIVPNLQRGCEVAHFIGAPAVVEIGGDRAARQCADG